MINSIAFTAYPVKEIPRARAFYENVLGLKLDANFRDEWIEYDVGGATFAITTMEMGRTPGAPGAVTAFEVDNLEAEIARLKSHAVTFILEPVETPVCHLAVIADPDGNHLVVHKRK